MIWQIPLFFFLAISWTDGYVHTGSIFEHVKDSINKLEKEFNTSHPDVAEGGSIFTEKLRSDLWSEANEKKIIFGQVISMYLNMLSNLNDTKHPEHVTNLIEAMQEYKRKYNEGLKKATDIIELSKLPLNEVKLQRKAIAELYQVLEKVNKEESQRKRRSRKPNLRG